MKWRRWLRIPKLIVLSILLLLLLAPEWPAFSDEKYRLREIVGQREFDYLSWETSALLDKGESILAGGHLYLNQESKKEIVLEYLQLVQDARRLEFDIRNEYVDPKVIDPDLTTQKWQTQLKVIRQEIENKQLLAEAIVQDQVATILKTEGFAILDKSWPPVLMHVTPIPSLLVVSPREYIEKKHEVSLITGLSTPDQDAMETAVYDNLDLSALVVPLGGIGTYPSMINETSNINRLAEVTSHEWGHHWLTLHPLGLTYAFDPEVRIINETVASIIGQELGSKVVERYYPELLPPPLEDQAQSLEDPNAFDFRAELAATRIGAEELLAQGKIDEAESYMENRRRLFVENGYAIRKLNQAYFAFYGAYAAEPGGAQGGNPIGPMLRDIREQSPSIRVFLDTVAPITSFADLQEIHQNIVPASGSVS